MKISDILKVTDGKLISGDAYGNIDLVSISTDSRTIKKGEFFLPLKGNNFNGEEFVGEALKKGAIGILVTRSPGHSSQDKIIIQVKDTAMALQRIAHCHRIKFDIPVIGVTGSNGKTTTKDMITDVLAARFNVLKNEGTKNNHIGLPQTLLKLNKKHDMCVLEMGANHQGEIRLLADMARPGIAVITNIGPSHLKFLKDLEGVFTAKKEILEFLGRGSLAIVNGDDDYLYGLKSKTFNIVRFGFNKRNDLRASLISSGFGRRIEFLLNDKTHFTLNVLGSHNVYNALAAIAIGRHFKLNMKLIEKGLARYRPGPMRLNLMKIGGIIVINDAYNSNPLSMRCALEAMNDIAANAKWVVSADMLELGREEDSFHSMIGESIARAGFKGLLTFGRLSRYTYNRALECGMDKTYLWHCSTLDEAADILCKVTRKGDAILIKGSRAMGMETVIEKLKIQSHKR